MKNILTALLILLSGMVVAQTSPSSDTIKIPVAVAKQIAIDLTSYDSTKTVLNITQSELDLTKDQLAYKDSLLNNAVNNVAGLSNQLTNQQQQSDAYKQLYTVKKDDFNAVNDKLRKHKALRNFIDITGVVVLAIVAYIIAK